ncbi:MAG: VWA domain-containing protein [Nisaea sp.]|uniref:VWA domain-containing protein n=1 Tax=Nisaea sp. TaxID=2024842 RepID=UPI00326434CF
MICTLLSRLPLFGYDIVCTETGLIATLAAALFLAGAAVSLAFVLRAACTSVKAALAGCAGVIGLLAMSFASNGPALQAQTPQSIGGHIIALLDTSQSMTRAGAGFTDAQTALADRIEESIRQNEDTILPNWSGEVITFGGTPSMGSSDVSLAALPNAVRASSPGADDLGSDIAGGIESAIEEIGANGGKGAIWLLSDGNFSGALPREAARAAANAGIPIHVSAFGSISPGSGLLSYNVGPEQFVGTDVVTRLTVLGDGEIEWARNGERDEERNVQEFSDVARPTGVRLETQFDARGLQFIELRVRNARGQVENVEHLYTLVRGPLRILVYGDAPWIDGFESAQVLVTRAEPRDATVLSEFDVIVVAALTPRAFRPDFVSDMRGASAVGTGLFLINGPLRGSVEDMQLIRDWEETELGDFLPVNSSPSDYVAKPPDRDILIVIDTSGSMAPEFGNGQRLDIAKDAAKQIIEQVRPQDTVTILPFSGAAGSELGPINGTDGNKNTLVGFVDQLVASGGTNFQHAVAAANNLRGNNCAFFFISDADDNPPATRLRCYTTLIGVEGQKYRGGISAFAGGHGQEKNPRTRSEVPGITFDVFEPEVRSRFWKEGRFSAEAEPGEERYLPTISINGQALSYPRPWPATTVSLFHEQPAYEPLLAFRTDPEQRLVTTGVYLSDMDAAWRPHRDQTHAILRRLSGWEDQDRYDIRVRTEGGEIKIKVTVISTDKVGSIGASVLMADGVTQSLALQQTGFDGEFEGRFAPSLGREPSRASLVLEEADRAPQVIPFWLPARSDIGKDGRSLDEARSYGVNGAVLREIREVTRGLDLSVSVPVLAENDTTATQHDLWRSLIAFGVLTFAAGLYLGGHRP